MPDDIVREVSAVLTRNDWPGSRSYEQIAADLEGMLAAIALPTFDKVMVPRPPPHSPQVTHGEGLLHFLGFLIAVGRQRPNERGPGG